jgi:hypothetical protein
MKKVLAVVLAAAFVCIGAYNASAQVPLLKVVFNEDFGTDSKDCPGPVLDTLAVIGSNFNTYLGAIEYGVSFPPSISLIGEMFLPNKVVSIGTSDVTAGPDFGLTIGFGNNPVNAFSTAVIHRMIVVWNCSSCGPPSDDVIQVVPNGLSNELRGAVWPTSVLFDIYGGTSVICPSSVPVQEQTWGQIKSLYGD